MTDTETERAERDKWYDTLTYSCESCDVEIQGHSGDPQEAPWLYCPECGAEMELEVDWE